MPVETPCTARRLVARDIPGRGRGICATEPIRRGEFLLTCRAFGFVLDIEGNETQQLCHGCHRFRLSPQACCSGCSTTYCSDACLQTDLANGHALCCPALARVDAMSHKKASARERGMVRFLFRAFASCRARAAGCAFELEPKRDADARRLPMPTFRDALGQVGQDKGIANYAKCEGEWPQDSNPRPLPLIQSLIESCNTLRGIRPLAGHRQRAVRLAEVLGGGKLISSRQDALKLLRTAPANSFALYDTASVCRGWVMYPHGMRPHASPVSRSAHRWLLNVCVRMSVSQHLSSTTRACRIVRPSLLAMRRPSTPWPT